MLEKSTNTSLQTGSFFDANGGKLILFFEDFRDSFVVVEEASEVLSGKVSSTNDRSKSLLVLSFTPFISVSIIINAACNF